MIVESYDCGDGTSANGTFAKRCRLVCMCAGSREPIDVWETYFR
jgi:hypothetical protein